jgi:chemotaxis protein methyltransferase CheR
MLIPDLNPVSPSAAMGALSQLLEARTGQQIAANRAWRIETALKPLLRALAIDTLDGLVAALALDREGVIRDQVVNLLLNQETSFFRDAGVLEMTADAVAAIAMENPDRRPKIWSAACANGQEPLSLAMLFAERAKQSNMPEPEILATDVSEIAVARARLGRYSQFEIQRGLPIRRMIEWFEADENEWVARPELLRRIIFRRHNLVGDALPVGRFDVVLCRNVLLYLSPALRRQVFDSLAGVIRPGGLLVLGAGETVIGQTDAFVPSTRYRGLYEPSTAVSKTMGSGTA